MHQGPKVIEMQLDEEHSVNMISNSPKSRPPAFLAVNSEKAIFAAQQNVDSSQKAPLNRQTSHFTHELSQ